MGDDPRRQSACYSARGLETGRLRIFISYRREDSAGQAGRLNDRLSAVFGAGEVFMDVDDIRDAAALIQELGGKPLRRPQGPKAGGSGRRRWFVFSGAAIAAAIGGWQVWQRQSVKAAVSPPTVADVDVTGAWEADVFYEWDKRTVREPFRFRFVAGQLVGSAGFLGYPRGIIGGEVKGRTIAFETRSPASIGDKDFEYVHRYRGDIADDEIRMVMQTTGPYRTVLLTSSCCDGRGPRMAGPGQQASAVG